jgi:hypothetical protein
VQCNSKRGIEEKFEEKVSYIFIEKYSKCKTD